MLSNLHDKKQRLKLLFETLFYAVNIEQIVIKIFSEWIIER
jgi:hypothetical protein